MSCFSLVRSVEPAPNIRVLLYRHQSLPGVMLLRLDGFLDNVNTQAFLNFARGLQQDSSILGLDLAGLSYMSSTGVGALSQLTLEARRSGHWFFLTRLPERIRKVLEVLGFEGGFNLVDDAANFNYEPVIPALAAKAP